MRPQSSMGFGAKHLHAPEFGHNYALFSYWSKGNAGTYFNKTRGARIRSWFRSINAHDEQKIIKLSWNGHSKKVQNPFSGVDCHWGSAHPRGGTSVRSWLESVRNRAITRGNACCPIARQALRRPRILQSVGQRSKATIDQTREEDSMQDGKFRVCCPRIVVKQDSSSSCSRNEVTNRRREIGAIIQKAEIKMTNKQRKIACETSRSGWRRSQTNSKIHKCQHSQTLFKIQIRTVVLNWYRGRTLLKPTFPKTEIAKSACEPKWQGLLAEDVLVQSCPERKILVIW